MKRRVVIDSDEDSSDEEPPEPIPRRVKPNPPSPCVVISDDECPGSSLILEPVSGIKRGSTEMSGDAPRWECTRCTLLNSAANDSCELCEAPRGGARKSKKTTQANKGGLQGVLQFEPVQKSAPRAVAKPTKVGARRPKHELLTHESAPQHEADLAVHPKKVAEIKEWMDRATADSRPGSELLILLGPPGCAKTTSIRVLSQSLGIHLVEWCERGQARDQSWMARRDSSLTDPSQHRLAGFRDFLLRSRGFRSLCTPHERQLTLIDELPIMVNEDQEKAFLETLVEFTQRECHCHSAAALLLTTGCGLGDDHKWIDKLASRPGVQLIKMNPVADTFLKRALSQIQGAGSKRKSADSLRLLASAGGDMRAAITATQLGAGHHCQLDERLNLFKAIGKILYSKRVPTEDGSRGALTIDPEAVVTASGMDPGLVCMFLHDNYLKAVDEEDVDAVAQICDGFATADLFIANPLRTRHAASAEDPNSFGSYCSMIASRSLAYHNVAPRQRREFGSFSKPLSAIVGRSAAQRTRHASLCLSSGHRGFELIAEVLPTLANLPVTEDSCSLEVELARALSAYSNRGYSTLDGSASALNQADTAIADISRRLLLLDTKSKDADEIDPDPDGLLETDDIEQF